MPKAVLIGGTESGVGKTCFTLGLARCLRDRGERVQVFKSGPDYLDGMHHSVVSQRPCINLDSTMMSSRHICELVSHHGRDASVLLVEGVMGLFDGAVGSRGSSAELAKLLGMEVCLLFPAQSVAHTAAALLKGMKEFDEELRYLGVVFNFVGSEGHAKLLFSAAKAVGLRPLGALAPSGRSRLPSRHLGLHMPSEVSDKTEVMARHIERSLDVDLLLGRMGTWQGGGEVVEGVVSSGLVGGGKRVGVAKDAAFCFLYEENLARLRELGEVFFFSPLRDRELPDGLDFLYFPGGYPELYAEALSKNEAMRGAIRRYHGLGGRLFAECGGMMYLSRTLRDKEGLVYDMAGLFDLAVTMRGSRLSLGYRRLLNGAGEAMWGHTFHYSQIERDGGCQRLDLRVLNARGEEVQESVYRHGQAYASYIHLYWGEKHSFDVFSRMVGLVPCTC